MKWYESGYTDMSTFTVTLNLSELPSINVVSQKNIPYLNHYLVLDEKYKDKLYLDIIKSILSKYENVTAVDMNSIRQKIYTPDFKKEIGNWTKIFNMPSEDNTSKIHKLKNYNKYFQQNLFEVTKDKIIPFQSDYIGFTGRSQEELKRGVEISCEVYVSNSNEYKLEHIFIADMGAVIKKMSQDSVSEYFIMPNNFLEQVQQELKSVLRKYEGVKEIKFRCKFYDESIRAFDAITSNTSSFEQKLSHYLILNYTPESGIKLIRTTKGNKEFFIESRKTGQAFYTPKEYDALEAERLASSESDDYFLDDLREDWYSSLT